MAALLILEETQYYPFGLVMAGISSRAAGRVENKKKYNGIEYENAFDLNMGETFFRTHDPQLGRWWQVDPKAELGISISPFAAMDNNPISRVDPLGDNDYKVNQKGEITLVKETTDETDRLIAVPGKKEKIKSIK
jgi:RHS repeat-associated protein